MWQFLSFVSKHLVIAIPVMMVTGFVYGLIGPTGPLKQLIVPFTFLMVYPMMVTLKIRTVFEGGDVRAQVLTQLLNFGVMPFFAHGLGLLFFADQPYMALGLLLAGLVPTSGMTISWTGFARGNVAAAVKMTVIGLTLGSAATPFYVKWLMGANIEVSLWAVARQIVLIVFLPMLAGYLTQRGLIHRFGQESFQARWAPRFPPLSVLGVLGIVFIAIALKAQTIQASPRTLGTILVPLAILYLVNYLVATLTGRYWLPRGDAIALVYGSVMRNLSIALAIAINAFGPQGASAALVIALAYIIQVQSAAWYVRFTAALFGEAEKPVSAPAPAPSVAAGKAAEGLMPEIRRVLYATDLSESARYAARYACGIAQRYGAGVSLLHVVPDTLEEYAVDAGADVSDAISPDERRALNERAIDRAREALRARVAEMAEKIRRESPQCPVAEAEVLVEAGDPVEVILNTAQTGNYDLVIVGAHGHGRLEEWLIGSVSEAVVKRCSRPVLTVRLPA